MDRLLKGIGILAVALAVSIAFGWALGVGLGTPGQVKAGGGGVNNVIAFATGEGLDKFYIIDTEAKVILVYKRASKYAATLIGARSYEFDIEAARGRELGIRQNGYTITQAKAIAQGSGQRRKGR